MADKKDKGQNAGAGGSEEALKKAIEESQAALEKAKAKLAEFQSGSKRDQEIIKLRDAYEDAQFDLEASDDALREHQSEELAKLAALLKEKVADVDAAVAACRQVVADHEKALADRMAELAAKQAAVDAAKQAVEAARATNDRLKNAAKLIQAKHKAADAIRLRALAARKAGNPALAYYLIKVKLPEALDAEPQVLETDAYEQAVRAGADAYDGAVKAHAAAEAQAKAKQEQLVAARKKLDAAAAALVSEIEGSLSQIKPAPPVPAPPAPPPAGGSEA